MDLRRERRKGSLIVRLAVIAAAFVAAAAIAVAIPSPDDDKNLSKIKNADSRAIDAPEGITALFDKENAADEFSYEIKKDLSFSNGKSKAKLMLKNPTVNQYIMFLEIISDGERVLKTGNLAPGQMIKEAKLDVQLSKGEYKATAYIYAVDPESYETVGVVTQPITITIEG